MISRGSVGHGCRRALGLALVLVLALAPGSRAHEGHDHAEPEPVTADPSLVVRSASNQDYEVVLKYRSLRGERSATIRVHVSDFGTNAPIEKALVGLRTTTPRPLNVNAAALAPGVYEAALPFEQAGRYALILSIGTSPGAEFAFPNLPMGENLASAPGSAVAGSGLPWRTMGGVAAVLLAVLALVIRRRATRSISRAALLVAASACGAALVWRGAVATEEDAHRPEPASSVPATVSERHYMPKESQFLLGVRTLVGRLESLRTRVNAVGHVVPESGALATVEAPQSGKLERVSRLAVGNRVRQGQVIANLLVIDELPIRAPISGLVAEVRFSAGQWVQAGDPLLVILDERRVRVELPLFGQNLSLAMGARAATVTSSALPGVQFPARVRGLAPTAPEGAGEAAAGSPIPPLLLTVDNRGGLLRPGMLVEVSLKLPTAMELIAVPESAVIRRESGAVVFVHTAAEVFEQRPVRVVGRYGQRVGLTGAVRPGDRIVVEGAQALVSSPLVIVAASPDSVAKR